ncbi:MAG: hypothetical protein FWF82_00420 [Oscillospiraceae bacterium]|nr:hypothetical protein [Oscillospiraceae bacterium]
MSKSKKSKSTPNKNNSNLKQAQKVKLKNTELSSTLSIVIPIVLVFVFLVGSVALFVYLEEGRRLPDERYEFAERIVKEEVLIGLTVDECIEVMKGNYDFLLRGIDGKDSWTFIAGCKQYKDGSGKRNYEIYITHENGVAVSAVYRKSAE